VDHDSFRDARRAINPQPCPFEKAILAQCCGCSLAIRHSISERETVACSSQSAHDTCATLRNLLRQNSLFALKIPPGEPIPHAKEMKVMCGGLQGLQELVEPAAAIVDVRTLVLTAAAQFGSLDALPFSALMPAIAAFEARHRRR
jgi:hypothetical protein